MFQQPAERSQGLDGSHAPLPERGIESQSAELVLQLLSLFPNSAASHTQRSVPTGSSQITGPGSPRNSSKKAFFLASSASWCFNWIMSILSHSWGEISWLCGENIWVQPSSACVLKLPIFRNFVLESTGPNLLVQVSNFIAQQSNLLNPLDRSL